MTIKKTVLLLFLLLCLLAPIHNLNAKDIVQEHYRLGEIYHKHGLYKQSQAEFQKAIDNAKIDVNLNSVYNNKDSAKPGTADGYIIKNADILIITVRENDDLSQEIIVRQDGKISFPLIGDVTAKGETISTLEHNIEHLLAEYIKSPDVHISLK